ncbi:MAG TPA: hypothetical protein VJI12_02750 [archaeon]|nr:hypothetical protein [archaeon]
MKVRVGARGNVLESKKGFFEHQELIKPCNIFSDDKRYIAAMDFGRRVVFIEYVMREGTNDIYKRREWHMGSRDDDVYTLTKMYCYHSMRMPDEFSQSIARFDAGL